MGVLNGRRPLAFRASNSTLRKLNATVPVRLMPLPWATHAISRVATVEAEQALSQEAVEVLVIVGVLGTPTRREIEARRAGEDCEGLLARMCRRGLLEKCEVARNWHVEAAKNSQSKRPRTRSKPHTARV